MFNYGVGFIGNLWFGMVMLLHMIISVLVIVGVVFLFYNFKNRKEQQVK